MKNKDINHADDWFSPECLERENAIQKIKPLEDINTRGDFGSYATANRGKGLLASEVSQHNLLNAQTRVGSYKDNLTGFKIESIADLGCGLGFTVDALAKVFNTAQVTGYEISADACEFASKNFPQLKFMREAVHPDSALERKYDLILAQEFYPFTRTSKSEYNLGYAKTLVMSLTEEGVALITLTAGTTESILSNIGSVTKNLDAMGYEVEVLTLPFDRIRKVIPSYILANLVSSIMAFVLRKKRFVGIKIYRSSARVMNSIS